MLFLKPICYFQFLKKITYRFKEIYMLFWGKKHCCRYNLIARKCGGTGRTKLNRESDKCRGWMEPVEQWYKVVRQCCKDFNRLLRIEQDLFPMSLPGHRSDTLERGECVERSILLRVGCGKPVCIVQTHSKVLSSHCCLERL